MESWADWERELRTVNTNLDENFYQPELHETGSTRPFRPAPAPQFIDAHHGARSRAEARDRRVRDEDLALAGRPRLHAGNCQAMMQNEWGWW